MSDLATVKAEIKAWERDFKTKYSRLAQVQDIKEHPDIEAKYKLYKALGKASAAKSRATSSSTSITPSKAQKHEFSRLLPKARAGETTAPLSTFNPFSPQKNKGKQKDVLPVIKDFQSNPFATPSRVKSRAPIREVSPLSVAPFQPLVFPAASTVPEPTSAVTRARKRLRGEPVSPSPSKEKRRRVASGHTLTFSRKDPPSGDNDEDYSHVGNLSFVDDSPVKSSNGFKLLFDDTKQSKSLFPRSKTAHSSSDVFSSSTDEEMDWQVPQSLETNTVPHNSKGNGRPFPYSEVPSNVHQKPQGASKKTTQAPVYIAAPKLRKRVLSNADAVESSSHNRASSLIPPSPLPDASKRSHGSFNGKGKVARYNGRKKAKLTATTLDTDNDDEESDEKVKVVHRTYGSPRKDMLGQNSDVDADDTFDAPSHPHIVGDEQDTGRFDVDLPDRFRHVLAFSPSELQMRDYQEFRVIEGLLYGRRADHYDPSRGGEIWDVGEDEHGGRQLAVADESEDDWQGEPVAWELGEL
ncbi:uncharacterized protein BT62DRAFT_1071529 [Guyanagaster necrorhizus]|uniref:DNA replication regulator SLD2 n=1 Tax=Guyanagaster necrorhizus TaxID=856835 RepID=A0A9P8AY12_9AGAR|nr:uncharacterized protein BT62DRAFT_1071529 [Guyanagaster necrorhizus MCA 3950]KAG7452389.1 hypothetical protein BT62DRAFT_1071529 [Guyanagaster necrorhizus MCA 3950]